MTRTLTILTAALIALATTAAKPLGDNLLPTGTFDQTTTDGLPLNWTPSTHPPGKTPGTATIDTTTKLVGQSALKLHLDTLGSITVTSQTIPIAPDQDYFIRTALRLQGICDTGYCQGQTHLTVRWMNDTRQTLRQDYIGTTYIALDWVYRDQIRRPPPGTTHAQVEITLDARQGATVPATAWYDDISIHPYTPAPYAHDTTSTWNPSAAVHVYTAGNNPSWVYLAGRDGKERAQATRITDPDAITGQALICPPGAQKGYFWHSAYTLEQPAGLYRMLARLKLPADTTLKPNDPVITLDVNSSDTGLRQQHTLYRRDFTTPGTYQTFWFDFTKRGSGWLSYRAHTPGGDVRIALDHLSIAQLTHFNDPQLADWYPGIAPPMQDTPQIPQNSHIDILLIEGLLADRFRLNETLRTMGRVNADRITTKAGQAGSQITGFPDHWKDLREYEIIIFANAGVGGLSPTHRYLLREHVRAGGALIFLGGKATYGAGGMAGSFIDELLPIQLTDTLFDIDAVHAPLKPADALPQLTSTIDFTPQPHVAYLHRATPRPGAQVSLSTAKRPFAATTTYGKGRCTTILAPPFGESNDQHLTYLDWTEWPSLLRNLILHTAKRDSRL